MPTQQDGRRESELTDLIAPHLLDGEAVRYVADGRYAGLPAHDALTMAVMRLLGRWREQPFMIAVSDQRFRWVELDGAGRVRHQQDYKLPLKGSLVYQGKGVLELHLPGEPRRFLHFRQPAQARALYVLIDDQQQQLTRQYAHLAEVVGPGTKPALAGEAFDRGAHGETVVLQHETIEMVRPSHRPGGH